MAEFFQAQAELEVQMTEEALHRYENLCTAGFAKSSYVQQQMALAYYNLRGICNFSFFGFSLGIF